MTGTDGIDIILLHGDDILEQFLLRYMSSCNGAELMTVYALKYNTFTIECHNSVLHLKTAESNSLRDDLLKCSFFVIDFHFQIIELWVFCTPENRVLDLPSICILSAEICCLDISFTGNDIMKQMLVEIEQFSFSPGICSKLQGGTL